MEKVILIAFGFLLFGCDCTQEVKGVVVNADTSQPLKGVKIWKERRFDYEVVTGEDGKFEFKATSGGPSGCPDLNLYFDKEGYIQKKMTFPAVNPDSVEIRIEPIRTK